MIQFDSRYYNNAHRLSCPLKSTVTELYDGQWLALDSDGNAVISAGAANTKSYITLSSKYGTVGGGINAPITDAPAGRDTVTPSGMVSVLIGPFKLVTDQYETGSYTVGAALKVSANGKVEPWVAASDSEQLIVGYCYKAPTATDATIGIVHE
jgi:hypothetical protein